MLNKKHNFVNLAVYTHFDCRRSILQISNIIKYCKENNQSAIGIRDSSLYYGIELSHYALQAGIKPIIGLSILTDIGEIPVYIQNKDGYDQICEFLTYLQINNIPYISYKELFKLNNVIVLTGDASIFCNSEYNENKQLEILNEFKIFGDKFYIEINRLSNQRLLIKFALENNIPIVITNTSFFIKEHTEAYFCRRALNDINSKDLSDWMKDNEKELYLRNEDELVNIINSNIFTPESVTNILQEGIKNAEIISKRCSFIFEKQKAVIPKYKIYDETGNLNDVTNPDQILHDKCYSALDKLFERKPNLDKQKYTQRLDYELSIIYKKNFSNYFLVTADIVNFAKSNNIGIGPGRGSSGGVLICYLLNITEIDPIYWGLKFERFLNPERESMPDIDIDFDPNKRHKIVDYLASKYGYQAVTHISTTIMLQAKSVVREVCRAFKIPFKESEIITKLIPYDQVTGVTLQSALDSIPELQKMYQQPKYKKIFDISLQLEGICKSFSRHPAGIVINDGKLKCPLTKSHDGVLVIQCNMKYIEDYFGLIKFDLLGLSTVTLINLTLDTIYEMHGKKINISNIPLDDQETMNLFSRRDLDGVFQFESLGMRKVVHNLSIGGKLTINNLIDANALYRPGPLDQIPTYIARHQGIEKVTYLHPSLEPILSATYGIIVYQEQVMEIAQLYGYTAAEADNFRRAMGKKKSEEMIKQRIKFVTGAEKYGLSKNIIDELFNQIQEFSGYGFNKCHATPYTIIAYQCAYLKAHYLKEFMINIMTLEKDKTEKLFEYVKCVQNNKIKILLPCVMKSDSNFSIEGTDIRFALSAIKGVGDKLAQSIVNNRNISLYSNIYDFLQRNYQSINRKQLEGLILSGALDYFGYHRRYLHANLNDLIRGKELNIEQPKRDWGFWDKSIYELEAIGFFINNPIQNYRYIFCKPKFLNSNELKDSKSGITTLFIGVINSIIRRRSKNRDYGLLKISDEYGILSITCSINILDQYNTILKENKLVCLSLLVRNNNSYDIQGVETVDHFMMNNTKNLLFTVENKIQLKILKNILDVNTGITPVKLKIDEVILDCENKVYDSIQLRDALLDEGIQIETNINYN